MSSHGSMTYQDSDISNESLQAADGQSFSEAGYANPPPNPINFPLSQHISPPCNELATMDSLRQYDDDPSRFNNQYVYPPSNASKGKGKAFAPKDPRK